MEAKVSERWPKGDFVYEPKWDGFRSLSWSEPDLRLDSRNQRPLLRYFPELRLALEQLPAGTVVDGEIVVVIDGVTDFDSLQQRIHPAESRVNMLSEATPAELVAFDILADRGESMREAPFSERRQRLVSLAEELDQPWHLTPQTTSEDVAKVWFDEYEPAGCDGIIAKRPELAYQHGKRAMIKIKHRRTIDVVVGGFREHKDGGKIGSLLLGLYNDSGDFHFIGHCSGFPNADRVEIYNRFMELRSEESFDEAARAPGGPSRWSTGKDTSWTPVQPGVVVEVSYDQLEGDRFRHATRFHRWRPDKDAAACTMDQLERPQGPGFRDVVD
ncbi:MAG: ATP-dependent DNA ligase [Acidobacteria bacterium]|nr:MAG: ATP-dependent DNA ligase [Acidobacteriota bacterium]TDI55148.1 MAG: ATP-dependent DNA ligase [Acidobacteriota bacterium]